MAASFLMYAISKVPISEILGEAGPELPTISDLNPPVV